MEINDIETRNCSKCHEDKSLDLFSQKRIICKECHNRGRRKNNKYNVQKLYEYLLEHPCVDCNNGDRIINPTERDKILCGMSEDMTDKDFYTHTRNLESLFWHFSNIWFVYERCGLKCPTWFAEKYLDAPRFKNHHSLS